MIMNDNKYRIKNVFKKALNTVINIHEMMY